MDYFIIQTDLNPGSDRLGNSFCGFKGKRDFRKPSMKRYTAVPLKALSDQV